MAISPMRAPLRALSHDFQNPHSKPLRRSKVKARPCRITHTVTAEALDVIEALAQCFAPLGETADGPAFLCVLPEGLLERLAMLGAELAELEPSLGAGAGTHVGDQTYWATATPVVDGEEDAGEMPELDHADAGLADEGALHLRNQEQQAIGGFYLEKTYRSQKASLERLVLVHHARQLARYRDYVRRRTAATALSHTAPEV